MKKFLYSVFMLAAVVLAACSNDDNGDTQPKRGMILNASVENLSSRATMTDESGTWKFAFAANDKVSVSNNKISNYYTFTNNGSQFTCAQAEATTENADWYAYFPGNEVDLKNQTGTFADVANKFAVAGKTAQTTTGEKGLSITLKPKVAVLRVVAVDKKGILDIHVKTTADDKWVKGLTATKNAAEFTVSTSDTKTTLLHKAEGTVNAGEINYVVVPAGVKIEIYNGDLLLNKTKDAGLTAGKYYTITSGPTKGTETATLANGTTETVEWVQLWAGGPRFATKNVAEEMTWTDAAKTGKNYAWGEKWRTPTAAEVTEEGGLQAEWNTKEGKWVVKEGSPTINVTTKDGIEETVEFTGVQPGYTKNTLTLYNKIDSHGYSHFNFWTTTENNGYGCMYRIMIDKGIIGIFGPSSFESKDTKCLVRPVLSIQNITNNKK
nr:fimbrillin family protein [Prevotella sp.]